jgi:hypothetical protein
MSLMPLGFFFFGGGGRGADRHWILDVKRAFSLLLAVLLAAERARTSVYASVKFERVRRYFGRSWIQLRGRVSFSLINTFTAWRLSAILNSGPKSRAHGHRHKDAESPFSGQHSCFLFGWSWMKRFVDQLSWFDSVVNLSPSSQMLG